MDYCSDILWVDRDAERLNNQSVLPATELDKEIYHKFDVIVIAVENRKVAEEIKDFLIAKGYCNDKIVI